MANSATEPLSNIVRGVGERFGIDLANEVKSGTVLPAANIDATMVETDTAQDITGVKTFNDGSCLIKVGTGSETLLPGGVIDRKLTVTNTAADTNETDGYTFTVPANSLATNGDSLRLTVFGSTANTANNKTVKLYWAGSAVFTSGTTSQNKKWYLVMHVIRVTTASQLVVVTGVYNDAIVATVSTTATGDEATALIIKNTMTNGTAAASDITTSGAILEFLPA